jgi:hypothetical protein
MKNHERLRKMPMGIVTETKKFDSMKAGRTIRALVL